MKTATSNTIICFFNSLDYSDTYSTNAEPRKALQGPWHKCQLITIGKAENFLSFKRAEETKSNAEYGDEIIVSKMGIRCLKGKG